jgi:glycine oxidase ThiO
MSYPLGVTGEIAIGSDVAIIGGGLVALTSAAALAARGATVTIVAERQPGEASRAAAGMLAPGVERAGGAAHAFAVAARDLYPSYVEAIAELTGIRVSLNREGVLELIAEEATAAEKQRAVGDGCEWITAEQLRTLEPAAAPMAGAIYYPSDGAVDNVALMRALRGLADASPSIDVVDERAISIDVGGARPMIGLASGRVVFASNIVLAAGAWTPLIRGLPRPIPVEPVRGQMVAIGSSPLRHVVYGPSGYAVPRGGSLTAVGSTMERVGFDVGTTPEGSAALAAAAAEISPHLADARVVDRWSGLRPMTPDLLPILGCDPEYPMLLYACGHSRNGILLGPLTGECVAALASGEAPALDISPFSISRFTPVK